MYLNTNDPASSVKSDRRASMSVREWHRYNAEQLDNYGFGDRLVVDRGEYKHWALYVGQGNVVHFYPKGSGDNFGPLDAQAWVSGAVTRDLLASFAGSDRIRALRGGAGRQRPNDDIETLIDITIGSTIFKYCVGRFNSEHFVNFLKFGKPVSGLNPIGLMKSTGSDHIFVGKSLKTKPESSNPADRKRELMEICIDVARAVEEEPRDELDKYLFE